MTLVRSKIFVLNFPVASVAADVFSVSITGLGVDEAQTVTASLITPVSLSASSAAIAMSAALAAEGLITQTVDSSVVVFASPLAEDGNPAIAIESTGGVARLKLVTTQMCSTEVEVNGTIVIVDGRKDMTSMATSAAIGLCAGMLLGGAKT